MAKFVDLKRSKADKKASEKSNSIGYPGSEDYPYNLTIRLSQDELDKLGIKSLPKTGSTLQLEAKATVVSTTDNRRDGRSERSVELQLRKMCIEGGDDKDEKVQRGALDAMDDALGE